VLSFILTSLTKPACLKYRALERGTNQSLQLHNWL